MNIVYWKEKLTNLHIIITFLLHIRSAVAIIYAGKIAIAVNQTMKICLYIRT